MKNIYNHQKNYILTPCLKIKFIDKNLVFGFGSMCSVIEQDYYDVQEVLLHAAKYMLEPMTLSELKAKLLSNLSMSDVLIDRAIEFLLGGHYIVQHDKIPDRKFRFSRNWNYYLLYGADPDDVQNHLKNSHVCFIGCGGIGSLMSTALAANGVGKLTLIDDDIVEESNLTRQIMFIESDIGKNKVDVLKESILLRNSTIDLITIKEKITFENVNKHVPKCSLVILSGDEPDNISDIIANYCREVKQPYMIVGYIIDYPYWSLHQNFDQVSEHHDDSQTTFNTNDMIQNTHMQDMALINQRSSVPSVAHVNFISVGLAINDALMFLGQYGQPNSQDTNINLILDELRFFKNSDQIINPIKRPQSKEMQL